MVRGGTSLLGALAVAGAASCALLPSAASAQSTARPALAIGVRLPPVFLTPDYAVTDPTLWSLPARGEGLRWVRYYDAAALVDDDGVVRDVRRPDWSVTADAAPDPVIVTAPPLTQPVFPPAPVPPPLLRAEPVLAAPTGVDPRCFDASAPAFGRNPMLIGPCPYDAPGVAGYAVGRPTVTTVTIDEGPLVTTTTTTTYYDDEVIYLDEDGVEVPPPRTRRVIRRPI